MYEIDKSFFISRLETYKTDRTLSSITYKQTVNELFFVIQGFVVRDYNLNAVRLNQNEFHLSVEGQVTSVKEFSDNIIGYYCSFNNFFLEQVHFKDDFKQDLAFISSFMYRYPLRLDKGTSNRLVNLFEAILKLTEEYNPDYQLIHTYLVVIVCEIKKVMADNHLNPYPTKAFLITRLYHDLLIENIDYNRDIDFYSKKLDITPNHLNKSVKAATGKTAISLLNEISILKAKMLLRNTNKSIGEIAFELGIEDQSYFSRFFKKATGLTPLQYRNENSGKV